MYVYCICNTSSLPPPPPLSVSPCAVGCCRPCRGDLLPCCTELCWWRRRVQCQGQLSDKQSRCLTLTNSPAGQPPRQSFRRYIKSKCWDSQLLQQRLCALPLTTTASTQSTPTGLSLSFVCGELRPLSPATVALNMIVFGHRFYCEYAACVFLHNRTQFSKLTQMFSCPPPVQSLVLHLAPPFKLFWASLWRMIHVQSETMRLFLHSLLSVDIFALLIKNQLCKHRSMSMIYDITNILRANPGQIFCIQQCEVQTWSLQSNIPHCTPVQQLLEKEYVVV